MDAELKIKIGAETQQAEQGINKVTTALGKLKPSSNQATFALTNLSRVAQDAPFGFIGIANNINPLIDSFVSLKKETGSVKGALGALVGGLSGGGGLILLTGLASAAMSIFGQSMQRAGRDSGQAAKDIKKAIDVIGDATDSVQGDIANINALSQALLNTNNTYKQRQSALEALQKINKSYFGDLSLEKSSYDDITKAVNNYTNALVQQAVIEGLKKEIASLATELRAATKEYNELAQRAITSQKILRDETIKGQGKAAEGIASVNTQLVFAQTQYEKYSSKLKDAAGNLQKLQNLNKELTDEINKQVSLNLTIKPLNDIPEVKVKEIKVRPDKIKAVVDKTTQLDFNDVIGQVGSGPVNKSKFKTPEIVPLKVQKNEGFKQFLEDIKKAREDSFATANAITNALTPAFTGFFDALIDGSKKPFDALKDALKQLIKQLIATIAKAAILAAITNAIAPGSGTFGASFLSNLSSGFGIKLGGASPGGINTGGITGSANFGGQKLVAEVSGTSLKFILDKTNGSIKRGF